MTAREKRFAEGICIWCGKAPARENRQMCEQCAQRQRENVKNVRKTWKALHRCKQCGSPLRDAEGNIPARETEDGYREYTSCAKCRERVKKATKKKYDERKAAHQCVQCGEPMRDAEGKIPMYKTKDGFREYTTCEKCRKQAREYGKKRRK